MANNNTYVIRGKLDWAKLLGAPVMNKFTEEREWSVDVTPTAESRAEMKRIGISDKLKEPKEKDKRTESFITFRQREFRTDLKTGEKTANRPIDVVDVKGAAWPTDVKLGNGTVADVKFVVRDNGRGKPKGVYAQALRILEHVAYEDVAFAPLSEDDEFFGAPAAPVKAATDSGPADFDADEDDLDEAPF